MNGSSAVVQGSSQYPLDAIATGDRAPDPYALEGAFHCSSPEANPEARKTVLLVHGFGFDASASFSWGYIPQLTNEGFDVCWVTLPHSGRGDMTESGMYVAHAVKLAHQRLGRNIAVVGHSGGPPIARWGLRYDAEAASLVDDVISVAGANHGVALVEPACQVTGRCPVSVWQYHPNSDFMQALNAKPLPVNVSVTSIYANSDYGIQPAKAASSIDGAANFAVQDLCPNQVPGHVGILANNTAYRLLLDALENPGPADPNRLEGFSCTEHVAPGIDPAALPNAIPAFGEYVAALGEPLYSSQPPLPSYAQADVANHAEPGELTEGSAGRLADSSSTFTGAYHGAASSGSV
ncbi:esterase/lipase family protein [Corynebacterium capitovis]|uniref:esterase/lipase family protein n=1 Tax=Corynebacterium capitovis TaxID=131081 RepID=UPI001FDFDF6F|nr:lipase family protein [Corynebacterium capitovis]